jgi:REP element-mobilizing transposase RayT
MAGIARGIGCSEVLINGIEDHAHVFLRLPPSLAVAESVQKIKANSSKWIHEERFLPRAFAWQTGYAAFSVSPSNAQEVIRYIENQETHHQKVSFQEEYLMFLKKHGIEYDSRYVWG